MIRTHVVLVAALLAACVTPKPEHLTPDAAPGAISFGGGKGGPDPLAMIGTFLSTLKKPGPWDELERADGASMLSEHQALLTLDGGVSELETMSFFGQGGTPLRKLQERLRVLAKDPMISGFVLRFGDLALGATSAEELRLTLASLGKPVDCHADALGGASVVVAAGCTSLTLAPGGAIELQGPYLAPLFLKGIFTKVGVDAHFVQMGAYKGAAEALTRETPSPEMKETYEAIVAGEHAHLVASLAAWRKVDAAKAKGWIDHALYEADDAKKEGLVDGIQPYEAWLAAKAPKWVRTDLEPDPTPADTLARLLGTTPRPSGPHVALLYAVGSIVDGAGSNGALGAREEIAPRRLVAAIRAAAADARARTIAGAWNEDLNAFSMTWGGKYLDASLLQMVPLRFLPPDDPRIVGTVDAIVRTLDHQSWLKRYDAPDDGFGKMEVAFVICMYWLIEALAMTGRKDEARRRLDLARAALTPLGLMSEDVDPLSNRLSGNFPQAYSHVGLIHAAFASSPRWSEVL